MPEKTEKIKIDPSTVEMAFEKSRERWRECKPDAGLTWGEFLSGDAFIGKAIEYNVFGKGKRILEIGPGYGRIIDSMLGLNAPMDSYIGLDISVNNISFLRNKYSDLRLSFLCDDAETSDFNGNIDGAFSSATMHHFFPTNQNLIINISNRMSKGARLIYDVNEGVREHFEADRKTYIRCYTKDEIIKILDAAGMELVAFDKVQHLGENKVYPRLLIVAEKR